MGCADDRNAMLNEGLIKTQPLLVWEMADKLGNDTNRVAYFPR
jgi:hypothetical protein